MSEEHKANPIVKLFTDNMPKEKLEIIDNNTIKVKVVDEDYILINYTPEDRNLAIDWKLSMQFEKEKYSEQLSVVSDVSLIIGAFIIPTDIPQILNFNRGKK